jgi:hypothetical protein
MRKGKDTRWEMTPPRETSARRMDVVGHRRVCCYVPYTANREPQTQYQVLICESTRDSALCAPHTLEERAGRDVAAMNPAPRRMLAKGQSPVL